MSTQREPSASGLGRYTEPVLDAALFAAYERTDCPISAEGTTKAKEELEMDVLSLMNQQNVLFPKCHCCQNALYCNENSFLVLRFPSLPLMTQPSAGHLGTGFAWACFQ